MSQIIFLKFSHIWNGHVKRAGSAVVRLVGRQCLVVEHILAALLRNNTSCLVDFLSSAILFPVTPMNSLCCDKLWSCFCRWARLLHGIFCRKKWNKKNRARHLALDIYRRDSQQLRLDTGFLWHFIVSPLCLCSFCWQLCILFHSGQQYFFGLTYFARHQKEVPKTWTALDHLKLIVYSFLCATLLNTSLSHNPVSHPRDSFCPLIDFPTLLRLR